MLADEQNAVHRQLVAAERQGTGHVGIEADAVFLRQLLAQVVALLLLDVHSGDGEVGVVHRLAAQVAVEEAATDVVGVR